jgi:Holliday junction resolvase RusA-like endonuclease
MHITITVFGVPVPKGSYRAFTPKGWTRPIITNDNADTKPWQHSIVSAAQDAIAALPGFVPFEEQGLAMVVRFFMPRPKSAAKKVLEPFRKPDLDKLLRCLKDGLTRGGVYRDDALVTVTLPRKEFAAGPSDPLGAQGIPRMVVEVGPSIDFTYSYAWTDEQTALRKIERTEPEALRLF